MLSLKFYPSQYCLAPSGSPSIESTMEGLLSLHFTPWERATIRCKYWRRHSAAVFVSQLDFLCLITTLQVGLVNSLGCRNSIANHPHPFRTLLMFYLSWNIILRLRHLFLWSLLAVKCCSFCLCYLSAVSNLVIMIQRYVYFFLMAGSF